MTEYPGAVRLTVSPNRIDAALRRQEFASQRHIGTFRRVVEWQIEDFFELADVVDFGSHCDIGDPFEDELDHHRHAVFRHQLARGYEGGLRVVRVGDANSLAAE